MNCKEECKHPKYKHYLDRTKDPGFSAIWLCDINNSQKWQIGTLTD